MKKRNKTTIQKSKTIERNLGGYLTYGKVYPRPLPPELAEWYAYICDGGHSICCVLKRHYKPNSDLSDQLVPVPVRAVLKGYEIKGDYVVVDVPYSDECGVLSEDDDYEFDAGPAYDASELTKAIVWFVACDEKRIWDDSKRGRPMAAEGMKSNDVAIIAGMAPHQEEIMKRKLANGTALQLEILDIPVSSQDSLVKLLALLPIHGMPDFWRIGGPCCVCGFDQLKQYSLKPTAMQHE